MTQKQKNIKSKFLLAHGILNKFIMAMILVCGIYFVVSANDLSIKGFVLQKLKLEVAEINKQNKEIKLKIMELESYDNITKKAEELKMVKVEKVDYILISPETVARK
ncbi:hypothetical protein A2331_05105 [Candidatus Falkowbacteria bacterium RIFOXYB2_FULL_34_18]|uniref:Cell division protein FtsL n=1 Tax=Candidatus Falkowbacteria bacterium RIFOXYD2_FULL_34_120 TaxID=1798007 RepID=A0A1F5TN40_9BACT|nr:MAG: hypothetical protein A2500_07140 [Candidatus Falkowbacteria bacterium RIFOXYC12_FULL_34_55]OGF28724.1 MAG: hypothetical protein A2331_05105 [Candidatus Falkowbacteria bacterium RIFOXYB2_FULL_34_18]OGF38089.1 MAG: hypothetical protein A2466_04285 [Candidatus Falkowbacteria bacterium RIFOXYC2_FULL_34_220]OGF38343.1 MAG: hypothetical protein A2515_06315 [Candidatus Falkowbacteria bacterium RIFOXYD12_FULL_34_57]OGF40330.1 MAG: hypothetical protein A2531_00575 [Candidatus Falkowbacteria bact